MRRSMRVLGSRFACVLGAAIAAGACAGETGIVVEVTWDPAQAGDSDTLRIYVGAEVADLPQYVLSDASTKRSYAEISSPYRYLLRPDGDLAEIGRLQIAAALTKGLPPDRIRPVLFDAFDYTVGFTDGQISTVSLHLDPEAFLANGLDGECAQYRGTTGDWTIGRRDDADCDGTTDAVDCSPLDPLDTSRNESLDSDDIGCGDCLDGTGRVDVNGWSIDPGSVFPGQDEGSFRAANGIPGTVACLHIDFDCTRLCGDEAVSPSGPTQEADGDGSNTNACGAIDLRADGLSCDPHPSDCDETTGGDTATAGDAELCDGADSNCDGRPMPLVPCAIDRGPGTCGVGVRMCNDDAGRFPMGPMGCMPINPEITLSLQCSDLRGVDTCLFDPDPVACATESRRTICDVATSADATCAGGERLQLPGVASDTGCEWIVVGGVKHAEWDVGLTSSNSPGTVPQGMTTACAPLLVARATNDDPRPRTVMVIGKPRPNILQPQVLFLTLKSDSSCDGTIHCTPDVTLP